MSERSEFASLRLSLATVFSLRVSFSFPHFLFLCFATKRIVGGGWRAKRELLPATPFYASVSRQKESFSGFPRLRLENDIFHFATTMGLVCLAHAGFVDYKLGVFLNSRAFRARTTKFIYCRLMKQQQGEHCLNAVSLRASG